MRLHRIIALASLIALAVLLSSCGTLSYYSQAVSGHLKLMSAREPIDELLNSETTDAELRKKLQKILLYILIVYPANSSRSKNRDLNY